MGPPGMSDPHAEPRPLRRDYSPDGEALARLDERMASMHRGIGELRSDLRDRLEELKGDVKNRNESFRVDVMSRISALEEKKLSTDIFTPVQRLVYGMVTLILAAFMAGLTAVVFVKDRTDTVVDHAVTSSEGQPR